MKRTLTMCAVLLALGTTTPIWTATASGEVHSTATSDGVEYEARASFLETDGGGGGTGPPEFPTGSTLIGSACDDCVIPVTLPFPVTFYGQTYTSANVSSNGNVQFAGNSTSPSNDCLPNANFGPTIFVFQMDTRTNNGSSEVDGIRVSTTGASGSRTFIIQWDVYYFASLDFARYVLWFNEGGGFSAGYSSATDKGATAVLGVQASATGPFTQYSCQQVLDPFPRRQLDYLANLPLSVSRTGTGTGTVTSSPAGVSCGTTCTSRFPITSTIWLTAQPASNSTFTGWSGACSGTAMCAVDMSATRAVTAAFKLKPKRCSGHESDPRKHIVGTSGPDTLIGTSKAEVICGMGSRDIIRAGGANDLVLGGGGNDTLRGGPHNDLLVGGAGTDTIYGSGGADTLRGTGGNDTLTGGPGKDLVVGGDGNDTMYGSDGDDVLTGSGGGGDAAAGGAGRDRCRAEFKRGCEL